MTYPQVKAEQERRVDACIKEHRMFFAFSPQQFEENKTEKLPDENYLHIGMGAYIPESMYQAWDKGMDEIQQWFDDTIRSNDLREAEILYELGNHEAYYTHDIESTVEALGGRYTYDEVYKLYRNQNYKLPKS